jgi:hypothetical protein
VRVGLPELLRLERKVRCSLVADKTEKWGKVVKAAGISVD